MCIYRQTRREDDPTDDGRSPSAKLAALRTHPAQGETDDMDPQDHIRFEALLENIQTSVHVIVEGRNAVLQRLDRVESRIDRLIAKIDMLAAKPARAKPRTAADDRGSPAVEPAAAAEPVDLRDRAPGACDGWRGVPASDTAIGDAAAWPRVAI